MKKKDQIIALLNEIEAAMPERPQHLTEFEKGQIVFNSVGTEYKVTSYVSGILRLRSIEGGNLDKFKHNGDGLFILKTPNMYYSVRYNFFTDKEASTKIHERVKATRLIDDVYNLIAKSDLIKP